MFNITFQQIETFLTVAKRLNVSDAAEALYLSQSSVSKTIKRFEEGIGLKLFDRQNRGLTLTRAGEYLYARMRGHYSDLCEDIQCTKDMISKPNRIIRVGYPSTYDSSADYDKLKVLISEYAAGHPEIELDEILLDFIELKNAVVSGRLDIAFLPDFLLNNMPDITVKKVCRSRCCLAMSAKHPLASAPSLQDIRFEDLDKETFYTVPHNDDLIMRNRATERLKKYGITPRDVQFSTNFQSLLRVIRQGKGMSLCGYFPNAPGHEEIKYFDLPPSEDDPILTAVWRTNAVTKEIQKFIDIIPDDPEGMTVFPCKLY